MLIKKNILNTLLLISLLSTTGLAQQRKQTVGDLLKRVQDSSRGGQLKSGEKSDTALPESQFSFTQRANTNLQSIKPPRSTEIVKYETNSAEGEYEKTLDKQIQELFNLTKKFENSPNRGELWLRLAELYVEKATLIDGRKQNEYDQKLKLFNEGKTKVQPKIDTAESNAYNRRAIQLYEWFLRDFPRDPKVGQALYFLGYNYFEIGQFEKGASYYNRLSTEQSRSPYVGEAHFAMGDFYFENDKWADAYKEYAKLIKDKKHRLHTFALYKGAWCLYRLGKTEEAIKYLDYIIRAGGEENQAGSQIKKSINKSKLESEALRDIVVFYSEIGDTDRAIRYFKSLNVKGPNAQIEKLAYYYGDKGARDAAKDLFKYLIKENPQAKRAFEYQYQIVQNYFYSKNSPQFKEELYIWINDYKNNSVWYERNKNDQAFITNAYKLREQTLRNYVLQQHQTAQNSKATFSRQSALEGYQLYFQEFSDSSEVSNMHFFFGELLYDMGRFEEASTHYTWVVENTPQSKYANKAGRNLLLSVEKALPKDEELQKRVGDSIEPIPLDPRVEKFIKASEWYVNKFPNGEKVAEIKFRMGRLYYQSNHFDKAEPIFKDIVKKHPKTPFSEYSANLLLDMYNLRKDYSGLEKVGQELLTNESLSSSKAGNDIRGVLERANFKKAQTLEQEKKYEEAATQFQAFALQNPTSELAVMALFNAGVNFERVGRTSDAMTNYKKTIASQDAKAEPLKAKSQKLLAKLYQDNGQFEESAHLFKKMSLENPKDPLAANYMFNAAVMFEALGKNKEAISSYNSFIETNKSVKENNETLFNIAELSRKNGNLNYAVLKYTEYKDLNPDGPKKVQALFWIIKYAPQFNKITLTKESRVEIFKVYNKLNSEKKKSVAHFVAQIKLEDAENLYQQMSDIQIPSDPQKQKAAIDRKLELIAQINPIITETIKFESPNEIVDAIVLLGKSNENIGQAFVSAPVPAQLNEEQRKQYSEGIQKIADPFFVKAYESYKTAVDRGQDLEVYNKSYMFALDKMSVKNPKNYYNGSEVSLEVKKMSWIGTK